MNIIKSDFETLLVCAVRYALGRRTYITSTVSDIAFKNAVRLSQTTVKIIIRDINEADDLGDQCDIQAWTKLRDKLETVSLNKLEE